MISVDTANSIEQAIGYAFHNRSLLETALTHTSFVKGDGRSSEYNERLEFLGDAVLEVIVSEYLYLKHPDMREGSLSRMRAHLVCESALHLAACELGIPQWLRLGHGMEITGGRENPSIVSDAMEAVIGATFLDGGIENAKKLITERVLPVLERTRLDNDKRDYKTRLQEYVQKRHIGTLTYELTGTEGPEHDKVFFLRVLLDGREIGSGSGKTKQQGGQEAAKIALRLLKSEEES